MNVFMYFFLSTDDNSSILSIEDIKEKEASLLVPTLLPSSLNVKECSFALLTTPSASKEMLKAMQKVSTSTKKTVPESDNFAKRRKKEDDLFMQAMTKQSTALTSFATQLTESFTKDSGQCSSILSSASSVDDPILTAVGYALKSVPEGKRLECMVELLQIIKSKYVLQ